MGLSLLAGVGVIAGALITTLSREAGSTFDQSRAVAPPRGDFLRFGHGPDAPATDATTAEQSPPVIAPIPAPQAAPPAVRLPAKSAARAPHAKPAAPVEKRLTPQQEWETQRADYERARDAYDSNERAEGYRWAQQNRIRVARYCQVAAQRTPAFVEGCMSYVRPGGAKAQK